MWQVRISNRERDIEEIVCAYLKPDESIALLRETLILKGEIWVHLLKSVEEEMTRT